MLKFVQPKNGKKEFDLEHHTYGKRLLLNMQKSYDDLAVGYEALCR